MYESEKRKLHRRHKKGARNPNLQVVIKHAWHVCSQHSGHSRPQSSSFLGHVVLKRAEWLWGREWHSFGLPPRMNGMQKT